jgi:hypothetical protein
MNPSYNTSETIEMEEKMEERVRTRREGKGKGGENYS